MLGDRVRHHVAGRGRDSEDEVEGAPSLSHPVCERRRELVLVFRPEARGIEMQQRVVERVMSAQA